MARPRAQRRRIQTTENAENTQNLRRTTASASVCVFCGSNLFVKFFASSPLLCSTYVLMHTPADIAREQDAGLQQLFQAGLELALQVQAQAMAAQPAEQARLGLAFHRLSRGVRQTAALRMKLAREAERAGRDDA